MKWLNFEPQSWAEFKGRFAKKARQLTLAENMQAFDKLQLQSKLRLYNYSNFCKPMRLAFQVLTKITHTQIKNDLGNVCNTCALQDHDKQNRRQYLWNNNTWAWCAKIMHRNSVIVTSSQGALQCSMLINNGQPRSDFCWYILSHFGCVPWNEYFDFLNYSHRKYVNAAGKNDWNIGSKTM